VFTPFHQPPYTYPYGRSVDETTIQAVAKQVFMTSKGDDAGQATTDPPSQAAHDGDAAQEQVNPPLDADPATEQLPEIQDGPRPLQPTIPVVHCLEDFTTPMDKVVYGTLGDPITPDYVRDVNDLEKKRREILKEAQQVEKMGEKLDGNIAKAQDTFKRARNMEEKYATLIQSRLKRAATHNWHETLSSPCQPRKRWPGCTSRIRHMWTRTAMRSGPLQSRTSWPQRSYWKITKARQLWRRR
jgi:hypothetical protein